MSVEPGRYRATIEDYGIRTVGDKKTPQMQIKFKIKDSGKAVYFQNFLTEGTTKSEYFKNLLDTLVETKVLQTTRFTDISKGVKGGALNTGIELEILVDFERDANDQKVLDKNQNPYVKVAFINNPEKSGMKGQLSEAESVNVLGALNLDAHILESQQRTGSSVSSADSFKPEESDIPF